MPSFAGFDLGPFCFVTVDADPNELQLTAYPGVQGKSMKNLGARGYTTTVQGGLYANFALGIAVLENQFRDLKNRAVSDVLVDSYGIPWSNVVLAAFHTGEILWADYPYGFIRDYTMEFIHLSQS